jgi:hypothetical protein
MFFWIGAQQEGVLSDGAYQQVFIAFPVIGLSIVVASAAFLSRRKPVYVPVILCVAVIDIMMGYYFYHAGIQGLRNYHPVVFYPIMLAGLAGLIPVVLVAMSRDDFE